MSDRLKQKVCEVCGKTFWSYSSRAKYCSIQCARKSYNDSMKSPTSMERKKMRRRITEPKLSILEVVKLADQAGMSYGEYVAKMREDQ